MQQITALELAAWLADPAREKPLLLDVREPWEYEICHIDGAVLMPMNTVPAKLAELDDEAEIVCICHHGMRSAQVGAFLERNGFARVGNLVGGVDAWTKQVDRGMASY